VEVQSLLGRHYKIGGVGGFTTPVVTTKAYGGVEVYLQSFLTLALDALAILPTGNELLVHI
jgi:hypothetical protein